MSDPAFTDDDFLAALSRLIDGVADDADRQAVERAIIESPAHRELYRRYMLLESSISWGKNATAKPQPQRAASAGRTHRFRFSPITYTLSGIAAALFFTAAAVAFYLLTAAPSEPTPDRPSGPTVAVVTGVDDAVFGSEPVGSGDPMSPQAVQLKSGSIDLDFHDGSSVTLSGPGELTIRGRDAVTLSRGRVVAIAQPGFTIDTPRGVRVIDRGTAFRLDVEDDGSTRLVVLDGSVEISGRAFEPITLAAGDTRRTDARGDLIREPDTGYGPWLAVLHQIENDPATAVRLDSETAGQAARRDGRYADRSALDIRGIADRIGVDGPGSVDAFTIAMWIRPDTVAGGIRALAVTDDWTPGGVHVQLNGSQLNIGVCLNDDRESVNLYSTKRIDSDRWQFIAATFDPSDDLLTLYVDGEPAGDKSVPHGYRPRLDRLGVGVWRPGSYDPSRELDRPFDGGIDDVIILSRTLSPEQMRRIYEAGAPRNPNTSRPAAPAAEAEEIP